MHHFPHRSRLGAFWHKAWKCAAANVLNNGSLAYLIRFRFLLEIRGEEGAVSAARGVKAENSAFFCTRDQVPF